MPDLVADEDSGAANSARDNSAGGTSVTTSPPARASRIYTASDVSMIIGGASEDAKAKVGRLPVRD
jgi:hypothetical protein